MRVTTGNIVFWFSRLFLSFWLALSRTLFNLYTRYPIVSSRAWPTAAVQRLGRMRHASKGILHTPFHSVRECPVLMEVLVDYTRKLNVLNILSLDAIVVQIEMVYILFPILNIALLAPALGLARVSIGYIVCKCTLFLINCIQYRRMLAFMVSERGTFENCSQTMNNVACVYTGLSLI